MTTTAKVMLWGSRIGTVSVTDEKPIARFEYDRDFLKSGIEVSPIMMPLSERVFTFPELSERSFHGLPGMLADSLPDKFGNAVIDEWLKGQARAPGSLNAVERLCYTGSRGMGALEYQPDHEAVRDTNETVDLAKLTELASSILKRREGIHLSQADGMEQMIRVGTSAGGARAKAIIAWNETTGDIRSGQIQAGKGYGYWLIKFDGIEDNRDKEAADTPGYTRIEYAYYLMAIGAGISMNECRLYEEPGSGRKHFLTRRFDRDIESGEKLHMQTLGAMAHFDFNQAGAYSYEDAAAVMLRLDLGQNEIRELFRRMIFNIMARNQDDHVKNISFLMDKKGKWSLAPAYDMTYAYNPGGLWTGIHQMRMNGKQENFTIEDFDACGRSLNLKPKDIREMLEAIRIAVQNWEVFAERAA